MPEVLMYKIKAQNPEREFVCGQKQLIPGFHAFPGSRLLYFELATLIRHYPPYALTCLFFDQHVIAIPF